MELTIKEVKPIIKHIIDTNKTLEIKGIHPISCELVGLAGSAKTALVEEIAKEYDANYVKLVLSQMSEVGEISGYPIREHYVCKPDGDCKWITPELIDIYAKSGYEITDQTRMNYSIPKWIQELDPSKPTIVNMDDAGRCANYISQAVMEIIYKQEFISWKLPPNTTIILTNNPDDGSYNTSSYDEAFKSRLVSFNIKFDAPVWSEWADNQGLDHRAINFMLLYSSELMNRKQGHSKVNARNYTMFANLIAGIPNWQSVESQALILQIASGCFLDDNDIVGGLFTQFVSNKLDKLIPPEELVLGEWNTVKRKLKDQLYDDTNYRADIANVVTTRFINFASKWLEDGNDVKVIIDRILDIIDSETQLLSEDLLFCLVKTINIQHRDKCARMILNPKISKRLMS